MNRHNLKLFRKCIVSKNFKIKGNELTKILTKIFWFELFYKLTSANKLSQNTNDKKSLIDYLDCLQNNKPIRVSVNFVIVCVDVYVNGRKKGFCIYKINNNWNKKLWKKIEILFEIILFRLELVKKINLLVFLSIESFRYTRADKFFLLKNQTKKKKPCDYFLLYFFNTKHFRYFYKLFTKFKKNHYHLKNHKEKPDNRGFWFKNFINNFFLHKKKKVRVLLIEFLILSTKNKLNKSSRAYGGLFMNNLFDRNIFWLNGSTTSFFMVLDMVFSGVLCDELVYFFSKKMNFLSLKNFSYLFIFAKNSQKKNQTYNLIKFASTFAANYLTIKFKNLYGLLDILNFLEFKKINSWVKFLTGYFFSISHRYNFNFYYFFLNLIDRKWISEYLWSGGVIGIGINTSYLMEYKEFFIEKCIMILSSSFYLNKSRTIKSGIYLAISVCRITKNTSMESFFQFLILNATMDTKIEKLFILSFGFYLQNNRSKCVLKNLLKLVNTIENEKILGFLFISLALIYKNSKKIARTLFDKLNFDPNPYIRGGIVGVYTLSFNSSVNLVVTEKILGCVFKDRDKEVKRSASSSLGFLFFSKFFLLEKIIKQIAKHFNPFIRYGGCFSIAISSYFKNSYTAIKMLQNLSADKIDFVKQGALIALGLTVLNDKNKLRKSKVKFFFKNKFNKKIHNQVFRFGIIIGYTLAQMSTEKNGSHRRCVCEKNVLVISLFLFSQYWHWLLCILFIILIL